MWTILKNKHKSNFSLKLKTQRWVQTGDILLPEEQSGLGVGCQLAGGQGWWQEGGCVRALVVLGKRHLSTQIAHFHPRSQQAAGGLEPKGFHREIRKLARGSP